MSKKHRVPIQEETIKNGVLFRDEQLEVLRNLLGPAPYQNAPRITLFLSGPRGCGKTSVIYKAIDAVAYTLLDCSVFKSESQISSKISSELIKHLGYHHSDKGFSEFHCQKFKDLGRLLSKIQGDGTDCSSVEIAIVFDAFDRTVQPVDLFIAMTQLQKIVPFRFNLVFVSRKDASSILKGLETSDLIEVHLPSYEKKELKELILDTFDFCQSDPQAMNFVTSYADNIVDTFYPVTRDVREMRAYAQKFYRSFVEPLLNKNVKLSQTPALYRAIQPLLREALQGNNSETGKQKTLESMPLFLRYLLVAGFLCSYNPSKSDDRMVAKRHERVRKEKEITAKKRIKDKRLTVVGPQPFNFERLNGVFLCLIGDLKVQLCAVQVQANIRTLCDMHLFAWMSPEDCLDNPKFKCICEKMYVSQLAESLDLNLDQLLYDNIQNA